MTKSPCRNICTIDKLTGYCKGCKRNIREISQWQKLTEKEKNQVIKNLYTRKISKY